MSERERPSHHMTPDELRRWGRAVVDWIADYQERVESLPVLSRVAPGDIRVERAWQRIRDAGRELGRR
jgi:aromatic-L-amino-acid decarboxylase